MNDDRQKRLEEMHRKKLEAIHQKKVEEPHRKQLEEIERKRAEELERKRQKKSSQTLLTESILQEIDSTLKKSRSRPALIIGVGLIIVLILGNYFLSRGHDMPYYLDQIKPEMSYAAVRDIVPSMIIVKERGRMGEGEAVSPFARLLSPDARIKSYMQLGYLGLFPKNDTARIYFDESDKVVGIDFSLEKGGWVPTWGESEWDRRRLNREQPAPSADEGNPDQ